MTVRHRRMVSADIPRCVQLIASHPVRGPHYGDAIKDLPAALQRVLGCEAKASIVFERGASASAQICAIGLSVFVADDFVRELKREPSWFAPELARRLKKGHWPLLTERQLREANSREGLTLLVWEGFICPGFENSPEVHRKVASVFIEEHRGYLWKEIVCHQIDTVERFQWSVEIGALAWDPAAALYRNRLAQRPREFLGKPHVLGMTQKTEAARRGTWIGTLFEYQPPKFGFNRSEQKLLLVSARGGTDQEISQELGLSLATVKKTWREIYQRIDTQMPGLLPQNSGALNGAGERGRQKKQRLLAYLREHPEELRPVARKLLKRAAQPANEALV